MRADRWRATRPSSTPASGTMPRLRRRGLVCHGAMVEQPDAEQRRWRRLSHMLDVNVTGTISLVEGVARRLEAAGVRAGSPRSLRWRATAAGDATTSTARARRRSRRRWRRPARAPAAEAGVTVTDVRPGPVDTAMTFDFAMPGRGLARARRARRAARRPSRPGRRLHALAVALRDARRALRCRPRSWSRSSTRRASRRRLGRVVGALADGGPSTRIGSGKVKARARFSPPVVAVVDLALDRLRSASRFAAIHGAAVPASTAAR